MKLKELKEKIESWIELTSEDEEIRVNGIPVNLNFNLSIKDTPCLNLIVENHIEPIKHYIPKQYEF